jgi:hypothetical protein
VDAGRPALVCELLHAGAQDRLPGRQREEVPEVAAVFKRWNQEANKLSGEAKKLRAGEFKKLEPGGRKAKAEVERIKRELPRLEKEPAKAEAQRKLLREHEATLARFEKVQKELVALERRSRLMPEAARRLMHAEVRLLDPGKSFASVTSPLGTQSSKKLRLLGQSEEVVPAKGEDPRKAVMAWMRRPDNPYFAKAIVNRVWAHYFGRGLVHPPDNLSTFNPPSHPELLAELCDGFVKNKYDLKWLHRTILNSRTYQQSSQAGPANEVDRSNYAYFYYRRLPAEVVLDALGKATGVGEKMGMEYYHWPSEMKAVEMPYVPRNPFVVFMLTTFGQPKRNAAVQCDCERDDSASVLQVLSLANHPRLWAKIADEKGTVARVAKEAEDGKAVEELFLVALGRPPSAAEKQACAAYLAKSPTRLKGLQGVLWGLLNTREFLLQH